MRRVKNYIPVQCTQAGIKELKYQRIIYTDLLTRKGGMQFINRDRSSQFDKVGQTCRQRFRNGRAVEIGWNFLAAKPPTCGSRWTLCAPVPATGYAEHGGYAEHEGFLTIGRLAVA